MYSVNVIFTSDTMASYLIKKWFISFVCDIKNGAVIFRMLWHTGGISLCGTHTHSSSIDCIAVDIIMFINWQSTFKFGKFPEMFSDYKTIWNNVNDHTTVPAMWRFDYHSSEGASMKAKSQHPTRTIIVKQPWWYNEQGFFITKSSSYDQTNPSTNK